MELNELAQVVKNIDTKTDAQAKVLHELTKTVNAINLNTSVAIAKLNIKYGILGAICVSLSVIGVFLSKYPFGK